MITKLLIVDDSPVARLMLKKCLPRDRRFEIFEAGNGMEAISQFEACRPDLIFMDLTMPEMDGFEAIDEIRKRSDEARIIVTTADIQKKSLDRVRGQGVFDVLKKPPRANLVQELFTKIETAPAPAREERFSADEIHILQEVMNIAFGNAAADLGEVIGIYLELNTPNVHILNIGTLPDYLRGMMKSDEADFNIIAQNYLGQFSGYGILVFPGRAGRNLIAVLQDSEVQDEDDAFTDRPMVSQEKDILLEVGNILIGACVGKICELLQTFVTYNPPRVLHGASSDYESFINSFQPTQAAIIMEMVFRFEQIDINGQLLIITHQEAMEWLGRALKKFLESF